MVHVESSIPSTPFPPFGAKAKGLRLSPEKEMEEGDKKTAA